ncbi:MAG: immunoglobulin domain-containing protein [Verrucomicrobia bacterium]|nr:immunoglobulin domain-containing protein [Verrucomicrobiota bacterium]MCH8514433.1 immunoglobulin domain-containing protein [Kiritimatiellia bacterium]
MIQCLPNGHAQEWAQEEDGILQHNGSHYEYWVPTDAPAGALRVIVRMWGAGGGSGRRPSELMDALAAKGMHAVVVSNADSYREIIATEMVQALRDSPHNLSIKDEIFLIGNSRGGQGVNRIMQQIPAGIGAAAQSNPGNLTTPSGRLSGRIDSNQGGWTNEEIGPVSSGSPWSALDDARRMALGDPAQPGFEDIPVLAHAGAGDDVRYPASLFFAMEMQERGHPHFEPFWGSGGHSMTTLDKEVIVDFFRKVDANSGNTPPSASIDGPRVVVLNPGTQHTLSAMVSDAEEDDSTLAVEWRKTSLPNEPQFLSNDQYAYAPRYIDGVDGWIALHRYADLQVDGFNSTRDGRSPRVLSTTHSLTFTVPDVDENTPMFIEARAIDSEGFVGTDSVMVVANTAPRILEGPVDKWTVHQNATTPMRFRALDIDSATLNWTLVSGPANGTVTLSVDSGEFVELDFEPDEGYLGEEGFVLRVTDALGLHSDLSVQLTVANDFLSIPAEMNAVRQRSTDAAGALTSGSSLLVKTGSFPGWMNNRSAYFRFPLAAVGGDVISAQVRLFIQQRNKSGTETLTVYKVPENQNDGLAFAWGVVPSLSTYEQIGTVEVDAAGFITFDASGVLETALTLEETSLTLMFYADSGDGPNYASRHWPEPSERPALEVVALTGDPEAPVILTDPENQTVTDGEAATFSAEVFGIPFPEFQWQKDGVDLESGDRIRGVNTLELTLDPVQPSDAGEYRLVATNTAGTAESDSATLTINLIPPSILSGPEDIASVVGRTEIFSVVADGSGPLSYSWEQEGIPIAGAVGPDLEISAVSGEDAGTYTVTVSNDADSVSASAELTVNLEGTWTLSYHANGGGGLVPEGGEYGDGTTVNIDFSPAPTREDFVFGGWKRDPGLVFAEFAPGGIETLTLEADTTLYAHWMAPWTLVENFESLNIGQLSGQEGWTGDSSTQVIVDPEDENNQVMRFAPSNDTARKTLEPEIAAEGVSTLFFRLYIPESTGRIDQQLRLPDNSNVRLKVDTLYGGSAAGSLLQIFDADNNNQVVDFPVARETWYGIWLVLDYEEERVEWWIRAEGGAEPIRLLMMTADSPGDVYFGANKIEELVFIGWNSSRPVLYDDLYIFHGARRLDDPRAAGAGGPLETWLQENGLEDADEQVEIDGVLYRAGDLYIMGGRKVEGAWRGLLTIQDFNPAQGAEGPGLRIIGQSGRFYFLQKTASLTGGAWEEDESPPQQVDTENEELTFSLPANEGDELRFFRIRVSLSE